MPNSEYWEQVRGGLINGKEFIGVVFQQPQGYVGSVHEVREAGDSEVFAEHSSKIFATIDEARKYVENEWDRRIKGKP